MKKFDFIGDIHGHATELRSLLKKLDYKEVGKGFTHPERTVVFVGDYIDRGKEQRDTVEIVRSMCNRGDAIALMGNHEFNAIGWATPNSDGGFLRIHNEDHATQHDQFLAEIGSDSELYNETISWFMSLPVSLEVQWQGQKARAVHACWDQSQISVIKDQCLDANGRFTRDGIIKSHDKKGKSPAYEAIEVVLKGREMPLLNSESFHDKEGIPRSSARIKWWDPEATTFRKAAMSMENHEDKKDDRAIPDNWLYREPVPVFFGHYWLKGVPNIEVSNAACLDYSVAENGKLTAYRWNGESNLTDDGLVWTDSRGN